jgi:hypothetical protein
MATTRFGSNIYIPGTVVAGYYGNLAGTAYAMMQGLGTAYKISAGTAQLASGSVNVTTSLSHIVYAVAGCTNGTAPVNASILSTGTVRPACVYLNSAGTLAIVASDGVAISGTAIICWHAIGY